MFTVIPLPKSVAPLLLLAWAPHLDAPQQETWRVASERRRCEGREGAHHPTTVICTGMRGSDPQKELGSSSHRPDTYLLSAQRLLPVFGHLLFEDSACTLGAESSCPSVQIFHTDWGQTHWHVTNRCTNSPWPWSGQLIYPEPPFSLAGFRSGLC